MNPNLTLRKVYGEYIVMPVRRDERIDSPVLLNSTSALVLEAADLCTSRKQMIDSVLKKYDLGWNDRERQDISDCIDMMLKIGLLEE